MKESCVYVQKMQIRMIWSGQEEESKLSWTMTDSRAWVTGDRRIKHPHPTLRKSQKNGEDTGLLRIMWNGGLWGEKPAQKAVEKRTSLTGLCAPHPIPSNPFSTSHTEWSLNLKQVLSLPCLKYLEDSSCDVNTVKFAMTYTALQGWAASFPQSHLIQWSMHSALPSVLESSPQKLCRCFLQQTSILEVLHMSGSFLFFMPTLKYIILFK